MKSITILALAAIIATLAAGVLFGQNTDLSGTWVGETSVPNSTDKDGISLVLKKDGASYSGTMTDSMGMASGVSLENVKFENGTLSFQFYAGSSDQAVKISTTLKLSNDKLVGSWVSDQGDSSALELVKKK
ncbi:MAG: hypothetical protein ABSC02_01215 [Acidobacteriota bacterium]|jgi:hypothetical protein